MAITVSVELNPRGSVTPVATEEKYRRQILNLLYGPTREFSPIQPELIEVGWTPVYPYMSYLIQSNNLRRIDRFTFRVDTDIIIYAYHFVNSTNSKYLAISHEGHSYFDLPNHAYHAQRLLNIGWNLLLVQMPQVFSAPAPPNAPDPTQMLNHGTWAFPREVADPGYMRTFFAPVLNAKSYLKTHYGYNQFAMIGISGGGWTTTWIGALDKDIKASFAVAGTAPFADPNLWPNPGYDYEQLARPFAAPGGSTARPAYGFLPLDNRDLYAMMADNARFARLVYIENEPYFPSVGKHAIIDAYVAAADARVNGTVAVAYDGTQATHEISAFTGDVIVADLLSLGLTPGGASGAQVSDPVFVNPIAYYRGDGATPSSWIDRTGNANTQVQAVAANQPSIGLDPYLKRQVVIFNAGGGGDDFMKCAAVKVLGVNPIAYAEYTIFGVVKANSAAIEQMLMSATDATGNSRTSPLLYYTTANGGRIDFGINTDVVGDVYGTQEWIWVVGTHVAGTRKLWINGRLMGTTVSADAGLAIRQIGIGKSIDASPFWPLTGRIAEIGILGHADTDAEVTGYGAYVNAYYGMASGA